MKKLLTSAALTVLVMALAVPLMAQSGPEGRQFRQGGERQFGLARVLNDTDLRTKLAITDDQAAKLKSAFFEASKARIRNEADLKIKHLELANLMDADQVDRTQINQKIGEISALQAALMKSRIEAQLVVKETLTPDQLSKLKEWRKSQFGRFAQERMRMGTMRRMQRPGMGQGPQGPQGPRGPQQPPAPPKPGDNEQ
jgi:Spy/CpxP family protein refolding chaperone